MVDKMAFLPSPEAARYASLCWERIFLCVDVAQDFVMEGERKEGHKGFFFFTLRNHVTYVQFAMWPFTRYSAG
jgi:hypothetical protein